MVMLFLVFSDLHGSLSGLQRLKTAIEAFSPDALIDLGDSFRGAFDSDSSAVAEFLSGLSAPTIFVKGNCDFDSDGYRVGATLEDSLDLTLFGKAFHLSHKPPTRLGYQGYLFGHTHRKTLYQDGGVVYCNPGSIALPRDGKESFALMDESGIRLVDASDLRVIEHLGF